MQFSQTSLSLLIIDDSREDRALYRRILQKSSRYDCQIVEVTTLAEGLDFCKASKPDGVLLDYFLPDGEGPDFLEKLSGGSDSIPFFTIMLTGQGSEKMAVNAMVSGASDYLPKSQVNSDSLCRSIDSAHEKVLLRRSVLAEQQEKDVVIEQLRQALDEVKRLSGLLPICAHCKSIRKDDGYWQEVEMFFVENSDTRFTHGVCPICMEAHYGVVDANTLEDNEEKS